jgi:signal transduction histidine kinase
MPVDPWVRRVAALEPRVPVTVLGGPAAGPGARVDADPDQLDQLLINLVRNAADAVLSRPAGDGDREPPAVRLAWGPADAEAGGGARVRVTVDDDGPGLASTANLFVPFYSTKPDGSGIGLALARQIAEAHGGTVTLENRHPAAGQPAGAAAGCRATVLLPAASTAGG